MRVSTPARGHLLFGLGLRYQTSVSLVAHETPSGGVLRETSLRSHHIELGVMPGYRFQTGKQSTVLALFAGWAVRGLRPVDELSLPAYTLHGPCIRPELQLQVNSARLITLSLQRRAPRQQRLHAEAVWLRCGMTSPRARGMTSNRGFRGVGVPPMFGSLGRIPRRRLQ